MRIFYLLITLVSCVSFAADDHRAVSSSSSSSSFSSSSLNPVYPVPEDLQKALNIFSSHARDARFTPEQKANYSILALKASSLMQMLNPNATPKPVITNYRPDTPLMYSETWARNWFNEARKDASRTLKTTLGEIDDEIRHRISVHAPILRFARSMSQAEVFASQSAAPQIVASEPVAPVITLPAVTASTTPKSVPTRKRIVRPKKPLPKDQQLITSFFVQAQPAEQSSSSSSVISINSESDDENSQGKRQRR